MTAVLGPQPLSAPDAPAPAESEASSADGAELTYPRTRIVVGVPAGDSLVVPDALSQVLAGHLADTGLQHRVATLATGSGPLVRLAWASTYARERDVLAVFWIEGEGEDRSLYLFEPTRGGTWVRSLEGSSDADALLESLGTLVRNISLWAGEGGPPGMAEVEPQPQPQPQSEEPEVEPEPVVADPPVRVAPRPPRRLTLEAMYAGGNLAATARWQSGARVGVDMEWRNHVTTGLSAALVSPATVDGTPRATVWRLPIGVSVGYRFAAGRAVRPYVDAAAVVEPLWWVGEDSPGATAINGRSARVALSPGAGLRWTIVGGFGIGAHARVDLWVFNADLVVSQGERRETRLRAHPAGALVSAGLFYSF